MKKKITVAAIQMEIKPLDIDVNLKTAERLIKQVMKSCKCDLIVFPEDFITGPIPYNLELAQNENSDSIKYMAKLANDYKVYIVCGSVIKKINDKYYNTSFLINDKGKIILEYKKNYLWHPEKRYLTPGNEIKVVKTPIGNIGIIICWDLAFPKISQKLSKLNADIICCPSYWTTEDGRFLTKKYGYLSEISMVNTLCPARAIENEVLFIFANGAGKAEVHLKKTIWKGKQIGQSQICSPVLGTVKIIKDNLEGFIRYAYNRQIAIDAEKHYKIREDL